MQLKAIIRNLEDQTRERGRGATHCYGCLCDTCVHNVELLPQYFTAGETGEPCFRCDECRYYDGDAGKKGQWTSTCLRYIEAKKAEEARVREERRKLEAEDRKAKAIRATFKVIKGGVYENI